MSKSMSYVNKGKTIKELIYNTPEEVINYTVKKLKGK